MSLLRTGGANRTLCADVAETLAEARLVLADAASIEEIMGHEGMATREYFRAWRLVIGSEWEPGAVDPQPGPALPARPLEMTLAGHAIPCHLRHCR